MSKIRANGIELEYETFGDPAGTPLLLVMGLGAQMILWDEEFCAQLAERGHYAIRYDNRDVGLSTKFDSAGAPNLVDLMTRAAAGESVDAPYTLSDMASDGMGLLDALEIPAAHIVGASMGGMIVQSMAIEHPDRVRSVTSIMSTTGAPGLPPAKPEAMQVLMKPAPTDRQAYIDNSVKNFPLIAGGGFPIDEARVRRRAERGYDRCFYPVGMARQMAAIVVAGSRREALASVRAPALVIHGTNDPLVPVEGGVDTHEAIPGSELVLIEGMGHDLPPQAWPQIIEAISKLTGAAPR